MSDETGVKDDDTGREKRDLEEVNRTYTVSIRILLIGVFLILVGGYLTNSSTPQAFVSEAASVGVLIGIILVIWGAAKLKKANRERTKIERRNIDTDGLRTGSGSESESEKTEPKDDDIPE